MSLTSALGDISSIFYKPTVNPDAYGVDKNGQIVNQQGQQVPLYVQPNWFERAFNPQAKEIVNLNAQAQAAPIYALQGQNVSRLLSSKLWGTLTPEQQQLLGGNMENAITTTGGNFTGGNMLNTGTALGDINKGLPNIASTGDVNAAIARNQEMINAGRKAAVAGLLGTPSTEAGAEDIQAQNNLKLLSGENALIPQELQNKGLGLTNQGIQLSGENERLPIANKALLNQALTQEGLSKQDLADLPLTRLIANAEKIGGAYSALHPNIVASPLNATINPATGKIFPGRTLESTMYQNYPGILNGTSTTSSGTRYIRPSIGINPLDSLNPNTNNAITAPVAPSPAQLLNSKQSGQQWGVGDSLTGYQPQDVTPPIGADEALKHLNLKLDKDGNLQKIDDWINVSPEQLRQGQIIQHMVRQGKMAPTTKSHQMRQLVGAFIKGLIPPEKKDYTSYVP